MPVPTWVEALNEECERTSQRATAQRLGVSPSMVNQVLNGVYKANTSSLEARVRGELMAEQVTCPILGAITTRVCLDHQLRPFAATNPQRVALYRACRRGCAHSSLKEGS
jgi:DNA-binding transcriptional regulator YdaS (Cro superfamily)